ncbi:MAG: helix-turn-helix domain-containing protein [Patescibacteria group bacterium]|nr:helix-turn-helix domain-containing protein [Patescibacteria group bacterium]
MISKNQLEEIRDGLLQLEFSEKEIAVYLALLQSKESSIPSIAKETGLGRGTVYDIVEKLKIKGYAAEVRKGKKRRIVVESPANRFYSLLDEKHEQLQKAKEAVDRLLPDLQALDVNGDFKPQVRIYEGEKGYCQVWDEIFASKEKSWVGIARLETLIKFMGQDFLRGIEERKIKFGFSSRAINEDSPLAQTMVANDEKYRRETRLAPKEFQFTASEIIFGDKVAMFSTRKENIIVVMESKDFAETQRQYFEMIWKFLEK